MQSKDEIIEKLECKQWDLNNCAGLTSRYQNGKLSIAQSSPTNEWRLTEWIYIYIYLCIYLWECLLPAKWDCYGFHPRLLTGGSIHESTRKQKAKEDSSPSPTLTNIWMKILPWRKRNSPWGVLESATCVSTEQKSNLAIPKKRNLGF